MVWTNFGASRFCVQPPRGAKANNPTRATHGAIGLIAIYLRSAGNAGVIAAVPGRARRAVRTVDFRKTLVAHIGGRGDGRRKNGGRGNDHGDGFHSNSPKLAHGEA